MKNFIFGFTETYYQSNLALFFNKS